MNEKILIIGLGVSGRSCAAFLLKNSSSVVAVDRNKQTLLADPRIQLLQQKGLEIFSDSEDLSAFRFSQVIVSPGVDLNHPLVLKAKKEGVEVIGEIEWAFRYIKNRCIGVTGTNGKTTTTLLTVHVLNEMGMKARAVGNVGFSLSSYLMDPDPEEILVVELSSFQLETFQTRSLLAALLLNITPNHLDRHPSMEAYAKAKLQIQNCLLPEYGRFYVSSQIASQYSLNLKNFEIFDATISKVGYTERGAGHEQNVRAAYVLCRLMGVASSDFYEKIKSFRKLPHRIEWVAEINGVAYYNDSKATNVDAVMYALAQFTGSVILLAGGVDKGASYRPWIDAFASKVRKLIVFGQAAEKIERELVGFFSIQKVATLQEAVKVAKQIAIEKEIVLLSPGCSSYDQFVNYEERGEKFKREVLSR